MLRVSYQEQRTNEWVVNTFQQERQLLNFAKKQKLTYYRRIKRRMGLENIIMGGRMEGRRPRGCTKMQWFGDVNAWMGMDGGSWEIRRALDRAAFHQGVINALRSVR